MSAPVFLLDQDLWDDVQPGDLAYLGGEEARHALRVQRLKPGESVELVDGRGRRLLGQVAEMSAQASPADNGEALLAVSIQQIRREVDRAAGLVLVQALAKGGRDEMAVEAAVELGISMVVPWQAERSVARWPGAKAQRGQQRWQAICRSAVKVSRRSWLPEVATLKRTDQLVDALGSPGSLVWPDAALLVLHESAATSFVEAVTALPLTSPVVIMVGPEGGISDAEIAALCQVGGQPVRLGQAVLRTSTAGPAALAALAGLRGHWS
jgi:16S rRNA (uracil1498-N3)-methyltransferase